MQAQDMISQHERSSEHHHATTKGNAAAHGKKDKKEGENEQQIPEKEQSVVAEKAKDKEEEYLAKPCAVYKASASHREGHIVVLVECARFHHVPAHV